MEAGPWTFRDSTWRSDDGAKGALTRNTRTQHKYTHTHNRYGSLLIMVMRALAFKHNGQPALLHRCAVPVVKRMTFLPRDDATTFYKKVGFKELCGVFTWFLLDPLTLSRLRVEHLWDNSPHHPVHTHYIYMYTHAHTCAHAHTQTHTRTHTHATHTYSSRMRRQNHWTVPN